VLESKAWQDTNEDQTYTSNCNIFERCHCLADEK
jgi:hypothetical protein